MSIETLEIVTTIAAGLLLLVQFFALYKFIKTEEYEPWFWMAVLMPIPANALLWWDLLL